METLFSNRRGLGGGMVGVVVMLWAGKRSSLPLFLSMFGRLLCTTSVVFLSHVSTLIVGQFR